MILAVRLLVLFMVYGTGMYVLYHGLPWDDTVQRWFFTMPCGEPSVSDCWLLSKNNADYNFWLHKMPRHFAVFFCLLAAIIAAAGFFFKRLRRYRMACITILVGIAGTALFVNILKHNTGHYCPAQLAHFGGILSRQFASAVTPACFPASHPVSGFGLLALWLAPLSQGWRRFGLWGGLVFGSALGFIQMARGEHFLSHVIATLLTALFIGGLLGLVAKKLQMRENTGLSGGQAV